MNKYLLFLLLVSVAIPICFILLFFSALIPNGLLNWDAEHYLYIAKYGYEGFRVAFFPLYPKLWGLIGGNIFLGVILNIVLYYLSILLVHNQYKFKKITWIVFLFGPSTIFFNLPYTEAFFFLWTVVLLLGFSNKKPSIFLTALFLLTITRPSFTILIPTLLIYGILTRKFRDFIFHPLLVTALGLLVVSTIQYIDTGKWFEFFAAQKGWGNELQIPSLPLRSWGGGVGGNPAIIDGLALFLSLIFGSHAITQIDYKKFRFKKNVNEIVFISNIFLFGSALAVLLFRAGSLFSLNRFFFCVPFFIVSLDFFIRKLKEIEAKWFWVFILLITLYYLSLFESYKHIMVFARFSIPTLILILVYFSQRTKSSLDNLYLVMIGTLLIVLKTYFLFQFLNGEWLA